MSSISPKEHNEMLEFWNLLQEKIPDLPQKNASKTGWECSNELNNKQDTIAFYIGNPKKIWSYIQAGKTGESYDRAQRMRKYSQSIREHIIDKRSFRRGQNEYQSLGVQRAWTRSDRQKWPEIVEWLTEQFHIFKGIISNIDEELDIENLESENEDSISLPPKYPISTYPADFSLEVLHKKWKAKNIKLPDFQRNFVWTQTQSSKLIESFLLGLPVPAIYLYMEQQSRDYFVIDGQQRLRSVFDFFDGKFNSPINGKHTEFRLTGLNRESEYFDASFRNLSKYDKKHLRDSILRTFIIRQNDPNDDTSMYHIFQRLNTGGTMLNNQELRNCIYHGKFSKLLEDVNGFKSWRDILGKSTADARKRDIELILRFLALRDIETYRSPMKDHLNRFMKRHISPSQKELLSFRRVFEDTCNSVVNCLGKKPFHVRSGLNVAVLDSVMVAFSNQKSINDYDVGSRFQELIANEDYANCTRSNTTNDGVVKHRFRKVEDLLFRL